MLLSTIPMGKPLIDSIHISVNGQPARVHIIMSIETVKNTIHLRILMKLQFSCLSTIKFKPVKFTSVNSCICMHMHSSE